MPWDTGNLNDYDALFPVLVGKVDVTGDKRVRGRDRGHALASASTLNRLELGKPGEAARRRYTRIVARAGELDEMLVELCVGSHRRAPREIWLDLDATNDPLHGHREGRLFHGSDGCSCYLPLSIFCGQHLLCAGCAPRTGRPWRVASRSSSASWGKCAVTGLTRARRPADTGTSRT